MSSVDDRIVAMKFDNKQFQPAAETTLSTLDKLKQALTFKGGSKGLDDIQASANKFNMGGVGGAVEGISSKFLALSTVAITALANITNRAVDAGINIAKSLTLEPVMEGFQEYELKMGSIQTILSNTSRHGTTLDEVTASLDELNLYADKTIYNFGDMTKNIGLFTNAGIGIEDATAMIKGFSNEAAASGTSAQGAAGAAYQLSQALSAGTIRLMDWRSLTNVGMGNKNMQNGIIEIAEAMGEFEKAGTSAQAAQEDFNGSLEKKWLSAEVMTNYLKIQAGELSDEQMRGIGLTDKQIEAFMKQQKIAEDAATKVRTWTQLVGTLKEGVGSSWSETFDILLGDFDQATELFTNVSETLGDIIGKFGDARNKVLGDWAEMGGRDILIGALAQAWHALLAVVQPIKEAFRDIFPPATGKTLLDLTVRFHQFTERLKMGEKTSEGLKRTFRGVFAALSIGWQIVKGLFSVFGRLFGVVSKGTGGFLNFTGSIGDFIVGIDEALKKGDGLSKFFEGLGSVLEVPLRILSAVVSLFGGLFDGFDTAKADALDVSLGRVGDRLSPLVTLGDKVQAVFGRVGDAFSALKDLLAPVFDTIGNAFGNLGSAIADGMSSGNFNGVFDVINVGLLGGILFLVKRFFSEGLSIDFGGGLLSGIKDTFGALTDTMKAMQTQIQAKTLLTIAAAIGLLTVSVIALSLVDSEKLTKALTAMAVAFGQLMGAMAILTKIGGMAGVAKIPLIAGSMILMATAVLILSAAVNVLSSLSWEELAKGLAGVAVLLVALAGSAQLMSGVSGGLLRAGLAMIPMAIAIKILASAVGDFAQMSWQDIGKGMAAVAGSLLAMSLAMMAMPPSTLLIGAGLLAVSGALLVISYALKSFADMSWKEMGKGMAAMAGALALITLAVLAIPASIVLIGPGLIAVAVAMTVMAGALKLFAGMSWDEIGRGLAALGGAILILSIGLIAMSGTLTGSAALMVAAIALAILTPTLVILGSLSWEAIAKGLVAIAGAFAILGIAGLLLAPVAPAILALAAALLLVGVGMALVGVGALALATAFGIFAKAGEAGIEVIKGMALLIPTIMQEFANGIIAFATTIAESSAEFVGAFVALLTALLDAVIEIAPKLGEALTTLLQTGLKILVDNAPGFADAGLKLLISFLQAIENNIGKVVSTAVGIIVNFIEAIGKEYPKIVDAGFKSIIEFINGVTDAIDENAEDLGKAGGELAAAIIKGMVDGILGGAGAVVKAIGDIGGGLVDKGLDVLGIGGPSKVFMEMGEDGVSGGLAIGILDGKGDVVSAVDRMASDGVDAMRKTMRAFNEAALMDANVNPTITPVLDLSAVTAEAGKINGLLTPAPLDADFSYQQASDISADRQEADNNDSDSTSSDGVTINFEQHNTSPKALSDSEIYRNTRNQLALAKEALDR